MPKIILTLSMLAIAGLIWGMREFFHRRPDMFSVIWGKPLTGFWGRLGWTRKYKNYPEDKRYKSFILAIFPYNDFYHLAWYCKGAIDLWHPVLLPYPQRQMLSCTDYAHCGHVCYNRMCRAFLQVRQKTVQR